MTGDILLFLSSYVQENEIIAFAVLFLYGK